MASEVRGMRRGPDEFRSRWRLRVPSLVAVTTAVGSLGLAAGGTAGPLLAVSMVGSSGVAGVPVALNLAGSAVGALLVSHQAARGRRGQGLALGFAIGAVGAVVVVAAAAADSLVLVLAGSALLGTANSALFLSRYAAAAVVSEDRRGRALGQVLFATTVGAVLSPVLLGPSGEVADRIGLVRPSGAYLVAVLAFGGAALSFRLMAGRFSPGGGEPAAAHGLARAVRNPRTLPAVLTLAVTNFAMVAVMTVAPVRLDMHGNGLDVVGAVVALHVVCMFGPSLVTGYLADRHHPAALVAAGAVLLLGGGVVGAVGSDHHVPLMAVHLSLIGLGWNCGVVGGSALLGATAPGHLRTHLEGIGEAAMGVAAIAAAPLAGLASVLTGYAGLSIWFSICAAAGLVYCCWRVRVGSHRT
ncbi:putative MFS family arabinose efflux permease [Prauserella shujinwangii]|uniref:Putative MFS family arabinose efflux permease n=2 Tax=Prauserella shujinwangii TaxID=1453103 RepID=A0A2T0LTD5_9PSEU|nr:putative MFS family arabinose efflux permease [Prauserella shujinwangii]